MKWVVVYLVLALAIGAGLANAGPYFKYQKLSANGVETTGRIVETTCQTHQTFSFTFQVQERAYTGKSSRGAAKPCSALKAGDEVQVFYLPQGPELNIGGNPTAQLRNERLSIGLAAVLGPAFITGVLAWRFRKRAQQGAPADGGNSPDRVDISN